MTEKEFKREMLALKQEQRKLRETVKSMITNPPQKEGLYIHEAVKLAQEKSKAITRIDGAFAEQVCIIPTNTSDCCIVTTFKKHSLSRCWNPTLDDLAKPVWRVI